MSNPPYYSNPSYYSGFESIWHKVAVKSRPSKRLPVQSEQKKHYKRSEICSKITMNEDNITTSFDQVFVSWDCLSVNSSHAMRAVICGPCKSNPWLVGLFGNQWKTSPCLIPLSYPQLRGSHQRCSVKKKVLRNFAKFTGKHLFQSLFFNKFAGQA